MKETWQAVGLDWPGNMVERQTRPLQAFENPQNILMVTDERVGPIGWAKLIRTRSNTFWSYDPMSFDSTNSFLDPERLFPSRLPWIGGAKCRSFSCQSNPCLAGLYVLASRFALLLHLSARETHPTRSEEEPAPVPQHNKRQSAHRHVGSNPRIRKWFENQVTFYGSIVQRISRTRSKSFGVLSVL